MDCEQTVRFIQLYVDSEIEPEQKKQLVTHINSCCRCAQLVRIEREIKTIIIKKTLTVRVKAPARLRRKIRTVIF